MKSGKSGLRRALIILLITVLGFIAVVVLFISPVSKSLIEKYDLKYTGREITTDWIYINPFTGYVHFRNLKIFELNSQPGISTKDSVFISARSVTVNITLRKLLSNTLEITKVILDHPKGIIIQDKKEFNFSDLLDKFAARKTETSTSGFRFSILNIKIMEGELQYLEKVIPINYSIKHANFDSRGKRWDADTIAGKFSLSSGVGSGDIKGDFTLNVKNKDYRLALEVKKLDFNIIDQYLKDLANYGHMKGNLDAVMTSVGNIKDPEKVTNSGMLAINDFHFGKNPGNDYASFDRLVVAIKKLSPKNRIYIYDSISITHPYIIYERYEYLDNLQQMFGKKGANIKAAKEDPTKFNLILEIADYIKIIVKNFFKSDFKINKVAIYSGHLKYNDFSLAEKFSTETDQLDFVADSINRDRKRVPISFKARIKPYGRISVNLNVNPKDSGDFDLTYHFEDFPLAMFNPYLVTYTSFPLDGGTIELNGDWHVLDGKIKSNNHILVIDPHVSLRVRNKDTKWVPSPLIMALIREQGNVIDYEIPITGNLKDPRFHLKDVISDVLGNVFIKPARIPYISNVRYLENEIRNSLALQWQTRNSTLVPNQEEFMEKMVNFLEKNPEASMEVYPILYEEKEKEYILFYEAKKKYFLRSKNVSLEKEDSLKLDKMSVNDSAFVQFLNKQVRDKIMFTIQEKCMRFVGSELVETKYQQLIQKRQEEFLLPFKEKDVADRVKFHKSKSTIPYNGFSYYRIVYKGDLPENLLKAYNEMNDLNNVHPRKRFRNEREKGRSVLGLFGRKRTQESSE